MPEARITAMVVGDVLPIDVGNATPEATSRPVEVVTLAALVAIYASAVHWIVSNWPPPIVNGVVAVRFVFDDVVASIVPMYLSPACESKGYMQIVMASRRGFSCLILLFGVCGLRLAVREGTFELFTLG